MAQPRSERPSMPDDGVGTPSWEPLPWPWAAERLDRSRSDWFVTASAVGRPHALPLWAVWDDGDGRVACSCGPRCLEVVPERAFGIVEREDEFAARATRWVFS